MNILRALDDENVFAPFFRGDSWNSWRVFLASLFALPLAPDQIETYRRHTGRSAPPAQPSAWSRGWFLAGALASRSCSPPLRSS